MSDIAIQVENLGKQYRIGGRQERYKRFTETMVNTLTSPIHRLRRLGQPIPPAETIWALKDVSFDVKEGEVVGIIGRNGAGKTTLLKVLSSITEPTEGEAWVYGRVGALLEVGTGFHPELTGRENVYLNGTILGMRKAEIERQFDEIVGFAEVEKFIDTPVKRYSSGMQVRLAFSVAAHLRPEILLIDEVLAVGDVEFQRKCMGKMGSVAQEGRTVLFVSHNLPSVRKLCSRGIVLTGGKISFDGPAAEAIDNYLSTVKLQENLEQALASDRARSEHVDLKFIRFIDKEGIETRNFDSDEPIYIEVGYVVKTTVKDLLVRLLINDSQGNNFLITVDLDYPTRVGYTVKEPGFYVSRCTIPPNMFGTQTFYLDLIITRRKEFPYPIDLRKVASFETLLVHSNTKNYGDAYGIPMRPDFEWEITRIDDEAKG